MPRKGFASWDRGQSRWTKMIDGQRHRISCKQLNLPHGQWTKDGSWQAAKDYFAKLECKEPEIEPDAKDKLIELSRKITYAKANLTSDDVRRLESEAAIVKAHHYDDSQWSDDDNYLANRLEAARLLGITIPEDVDPIGLQSFFGRSDVWDDRLSKQKKVETSFTIDHQIEIWLKLEKGREITHKTYLEIRTRSQDMIDFLGAGYDVRCILSETITNVYNRYKSDDCKLSEEKRAKGFQIFQRFVKHLTEEDILQNVPKNLNSKKFKFGKTLKAVQKHDVKDVIAVIEKLPERLKLYALLALNCSMNSIDIANLAYRRTYKNGNKEYVNLAYVDLKTGRITRSRLKTKKQIKPPIVQYKLWPITLQLLKKLKSSHERWILTSSTNTKLVGDDDGTTKDLIWQQWARANCGMMLKDLRSVGVTSMAGEYYEWCEVWLANKPKDVTNINYIAGDDDTQKKFDEITDYIGRKFKQI